MVGAPFFSPDRSIARAPYCALAVTPWLVCLDDGWKTQSPSAMADHLEGHGGGYEYKTIPAKTHTEQRLVKEGYSRTVVDKPAWDEKVWVEDWTARCR